jgi:hypothetical protein
MCCPLLVLELPIYSWPSLPPAFYSYMQVSFLLLYKKNHRDQVINKEDKFVWLVSLEGGKSKCMALSSAQHLVKTSCCIVIWWSMSHSESEQVSWLRPLFLFL